MPGARLLHPRLGYSAKVSALSHVEFRVWVQYILSADDYGIMPMHASVLQGANLALDREPRETVDAAIQRVIQVGLVCQYDHQGQPYLCSLDWQERQRNRYPRRSDHPSPPADMLARMGPETAKLFARRNAFQPIDTTHVTDVAAKFRENAQHSRNSSARLRKHFEKKSPAISNKQLASSNQQVAISNSQGVAPGRAPGARSARVYEGQRIVVSRKVHELLNDMLGTSADDMSLLERYPEWDAEAATSGEVVDTLPWLKARVLALLPAIQARAAEAQREQRAADPCTWGNCAHVPRCESPEWHATRLWREDHPEWRPLAVTTAGE